MGVECSAAGVGEQGPGFDRCVDRCEPSPSFQPARWTVRAGDRRESVRGEAVHRRQGAEDELPHYAVGDDVDWLPDHRGDVASHVASELSVLFRYQWILAL